MDYYKFSKKTGLEPANIFDEAVEVLVEDRHKATNVDRDALRWNIVSLVKSGDLIIEVDCDKDDIEVRWNKTVSGIAMETFYHVFGRWLPKVDQMPKSEDPDEDEE